MDTYIPIDWMKTLSPQLFKILYLDYDLCAEYLPQFQANASRAIAYVHDLLVHR